MSEGIRAEDWATSRASASRALPHAVHWEWPLGLARCWLRSRGSSTAGARRRYERVDVTLKGLAKSVAGRRSHDLDEDLADGEDRSCIR
jgi:hypothetical protein